MLNTIDNPRVSNKFVRVPRDVFYMAITKIARSESIRLPTDNFETFQFFDNNDELVGFSIVGRDSDSHFNKYYYCRREM